MAPTTELLRTEAPRQFKQPSRKGKKAWRKNVDLTEVQEGLEVVRDEIIKGGVLAERPSSDLFALDTAGSSVIQKAYNKVHKPLKADEILAQRSAIPAVDTRKRSNSKVTDGVIEPSKKRKSGGVSHKEYARLREFAYGGQAVRKDVVRTDDVPSHDPWEDVGTLGLGQRSKFSFLEPPKPIREPKTLKYAPISLTASGRAVAAVKKPDAGISYNPAFLDWDELITKEGLKEVEAERKRLQAAEDERHKLERAAASAREQENEVDSGDESTWEGLESEMEADESLSRKRPERKTPAQRNKIKRRKELERKALWDAQMKKRARQAEEIRNIAKAIEAKERAKMDVIVRSDDSEADDADDRVLRRRKLGKALLPEAPLELVLPEELQDSLRLLKPEGNLLKDRFRSMLIRGKMETRRPITQPKKARRQYTEKWTYKDFKIKP
ncbi:MAG: hypothetical protein M1835_005039 [Candelina submexicana]|nr:MAG: hypothetical protein M1835_005039 [Candelina submexicana]